MHSITEGLTASEAVAAYLQLHCSYHYNLQTADNVVVQPYGLTLRLAVSAGLSSMSVPVLKTLFLHIHCYHYLCCDNASRSAQKNTYRQASYLQNSVLEACVSLDILITITTRVHISTSTFSYSVFS